MLLKNLMKRKDSQSLVKTKIYKVKALTLASIVCMFIFSTTPVRSQDAPPAPAEAPAKVEPPPDGNPKAATTTKDSKIPIEELELLLKPMTVKELQDETAGWLFLLKDKVKEISTVEIAINRQNQSINKQKEAADALQKSKDSLKEAEEKLSRAARGSKEYEEATKKVEEAKESIKKAEQALEEVKEAKKDLQKDPLLNVAVDKAKASDELETAQKTLETAKTSREKITAGTPAYDEATKKIDALDAAIKEYEDAKNTEKSAKPDSPDQAKAAKKLEEAEKKMKAAREAIDGTSTSDATKKSDDVVKQAERNLDSADITPDASPSPNANSTASPTSSPNLQEKGDKLDRAARQLDQNAEAEANIKNQLLSNVAELQSDRTAIVDRLQAVLAELELKGGDIKSYQQYVTAVSLNRIDLKDSEGLGVRLISWAKSEEGGLRWALNVGKFVGIVIASVIVSNILGMVVARVAKSTKTSEILSRFLVMLVNRGGLVVGVLLALTALEVSLVPILTLVGGASFILAFALQSNLGNFASGLMIMANKPFDIGDEVKIGDIWGFVDSITLASTKLKGFAGQVFTIPNNTVWGETIQNFTLFENRKLVFWLRVDFGTDLRKLEQLLTETVKSHPKVLQKPSPGTVVWSVEEYYISVNVNCWTKTADFWDVHFDIIRMLREMFEREGLDMACIPISKYIRLPSLNPTIHLLSDEDSIPSEPKLIEEPKAEEKTDKTVVSAQ